MAGLNNNQLQNTGALFNQNQGGSVSGGQNPAQPGGIQPAATAATATPPSSQQFFQYPTALTPSTQPTAQPAAQTTQPTQPQDPTQAAPQQSQTPVTVKFSNGKTVTFSGTPTQADIDEVASKMSGSTDSTNSTDPSLTSDSSDTGTLFTNAADQQMYNTKEALYNQQNAKAADSGWLGQLINGLGRGVKQDVVGLRTIGAKALNAIGIENNLNKNSKNYNPLLDTNSSTRQLFNNLVAKGQTGWEKAGKTIGDIGTIVAPGFGEEALAARGLDTAGTVLGLFGGTDESGVKLATSIAQKAGYLKDGETLGSKGTLAAKVLGNVIGGTAQTAIKNGKVTLGDVAGNALASGLIHGTVGSTAESKLVDGIKQVADPVGYAKEAVDKGAPIVAKTQNEAREAIKGSLSSAGYLKKEFGLGADAVARQNDALDLLSQRYLPEMSTNGKVLDANSAFDKVSKDLDDMSHIKDQLTKQIPGRGIDRDTLLKNMEKQLDGKVLKSSDYQGARQKLESMLDDKLGNPRVGGIKSGNMSINTLSDFISETTNKEHGLNSENPSDIALRPVLYAFRKGGEKTIEDAAEAAGQPGVAKSLKLTNQRMSTMLDSKNIIEKMTKDPNKFGQLSKHLFSLGVQGFAKVPGAYPAADAASDIVSNLYSKAKFKNITSSPILSELSRREQATYDSKIAAALTKIKK